KRAFTGTFSRLPVERSSTTTTRWPSSRCLLAMCEPMKPAPPVTRMFIIRGPHDTGTRRASAVRSGEARPSSGAARVLPAGDGRGGGEPDRILVRAAAARAVVRRPDRRDGGLHRPGGRGGAFLEGEENGAGRADVPGWRDALRLLRLWDALLRQRRDARAGGSAGRPAARRGTSRRGAAAAPRRAGAAVRGAGGHESGERAGSRRRGGVPDLPGARDSAPDRGVAAYRGGLCRRGGGVATTVFRRGVGSGVRETEEIERPSPLPTPAGRGRITAGGLPSSGSRRPSRGDGRSS